MVEVGDATGGEGSEDEGIVWLRGAVITASEHGAGDSVGKALTGGAGAFVEVARVLVKERRQDGAAQHAAGDGIGIAGAVVFCVALHALAVIVEGVAGLLDAGGNSEGGESDGIEDRVKGEIEFLPGVEWLGVPDVAVVEVGEDAEGALVFGFANLFLGDLDLGGGDVYLGGGACDG